jgi:hypothetical protein
MTGHPGIDPGFVKAAGRCSLSCLYEKLTYGPGNDIRKIQLLPTPCFSRTRVSEKDNSGSKHNVFEEEKMVQKRFLRRGHERMLCWAFLLLAGTAIMLPGSAEAG